MTVRILDIDDESVKELKQSLDEYTKTLTFQYWVTPLAVLILVVVLCVATKAIPTPTQTGGLLVFTGVCLALYAAPNLENGNEIRRVLIWSGNGNCAEINRRFGYDNIKGTFYALEGVMLGFGTLKGVFGF